MQLRPFGRSDRSSDRSAGITDAITSFVDDGTELRLSRTWSLLIRLNATAHSFFLSGIMAVEAS
jgi:hypothetical protein